jgi:nicotinate-nucleotide adenylyltransferase
MADHLKQKRIGLFGGSFNPIHIGHLNLACELREKGGLDEIWFIPNALSPLKQDSMVIPAHFRYKMVELAIQKGKEFHLIDEEVKRGGLSYTIDTVKMILERRNEGEHFTLCLAEDSIATFHLWKEYKEILSLVPVLVGLRGPKSFSSSKIHEFGMTAIATTLFEVSATMVRERLQKRLFCDHLVPQKVLDFIYENQLYFKQ